jgi:hypothetical protein
MTMGDAIWQWELIRDLWNELELEDVLGRDWPPQRRWQLDLLARRMRTLDEMFRDYEFARIAVEEDV